MLLITNLKGETQPLSNFDNFMRTRGTSGELQVTLTVSENKANTKAFNLIEHESTIKLEDDVYRIKKLDKTVKNNKMVVEVIAIHSLYEHTFTFQHDIIEKEKVLSLHEALTHTFNKTNITFEIKKRDDFERISFENFGDDNVIALFNEVKTKFDFEFLIENNNHLVIYKKIGRNKPINQLRYKHNIKTIKQEDNTENLTTYIQGVGKPKEDKEGNIIEGEFVVKGFYESPNIEIYGKREATPISNENITNQATLNRWLKDSINDKPEMTFIIEYVEFNNNIDIKNEENNLGDALILVHEPMKLKFVTRIIEIVDFPLSNKKPIYTISSTSSSLLDKSLKFEITQNNQQKVINQLNKKNTTLQNRIENAVESINAIDNKMIDVNKELEKLEKETTQNIEQAIKDTTIPQQIEAPFPMPSSNLWWDTSIDPMRLKRWNGENWVALALEDEEIDDLMNQMIDDVVVNNKVYTDKEIKAVSDILSNELNKKVDSTIYNKKVGELDVSINSINGKVSNVETTIDKHTGEINKAKSDIGALEVRSDSINANVSSLSGEVDNVNNKIDNIEFGDNNLVIDSKKGFKRSGMSLTEKQELIETNAYTFYEPIGGIDNSYTIVIRAKGSGNLRPYASGTYKFGEFDLLEEFKVFTGTIITRNVTPQVMHLYGFNLIDVEIDWVKVVKGNKSSLSWSPALQDTEVKFNTLTKNVADLDIKSDRIATTVSQVDTKVDENTSIMNAMKTEIEQLPDQINLAVSEGIDDLEIGGVNLAGASDIDVVNHQLIPMVNRVDIIDERTYSFRANPPNGTSILFDFVPIKLGESYTINADLSDMISTVLGVVIYDEDKVLIEGSGMIEGLPWVSSYLSYQRHSDSIIEESITFKVTHSRAKYARLRVGIYRGNLTTRAVTMKDPIFTRGTKLLDWSLAEEDRVNKTNVLSSINLSKESIKIHAPKVDIHGLVSFINTDGTAGTMINGSKLITGSVTAKSLNANEIFGNSAIISKIQSDIVQTTELNATNIKTGTLDANMIGSNSITANKLFINDLSAISANLGEMTSGRINTDNIVISGGSTTNYTQIKGSYIESRGQFTRAWLGTTTTHDVSVRHENGYIRLRNNTDNQSLYFSDFGISTYADASGGGNASGSLIFRDNTYSGANSVMLHSHWGVVALKSSANRVILDAQTTTHIEANSYSVYIRPYKESLPGVNEFRFWVKQGSDARFTDGVISYGNADAGAASGLRFQKTTAGRPTIYATNGNGDIGSGDIRADRFVGSLAPVASYAYVRAERLRVVLGEDNNNYSDLQVKDIQANSIRTNTDNLYIGASGGEARITNNLLWQSGGNTSYRPVRAQDFIKSSSINYKSHFKEIEYSSLDIINDLNVIEYYLKDDLENRNYTNKQIGVISELSQEIASNDGKGISDYKHMSHLTRAVQELSEKDSNKENDIQTIYEVLEVIIKENEEMKIELQQLRS